MILYRYLSNKDSSPIRTRGSRSSDQWPPRMAIDLAAVEANLSVGFTTLEALNQLEWLLQVRNGEIHFHGLDLRAEAQAALNDMDRMFTDVLTQQVAVPLNVLAAKVAIGLFIHKFDNPTAA
jgi:hypothetical protein